MLLLFYVDEWFWRHSCQDQTFIFGLHIFLHYVMKITCKNCLYLQRDRRGNSKHLLFNFHEVTSIFIIFITIKHNVKHISPLKEREGRWNPSNSTIEVCMRSSVFTLRIIQMLSAVKPLFHGSNYSSHHSWFSSLNVCSAHSSGNYCWRGFSPLQ